MLVLPMLLLGCGPEVKITLTNAGQAPVHLWCDGEEMGPANRLEVGQTRDCPAVAVDGGETATVTVHAGRNGAETHTTDCVFVIPDENGYVTGADVEWDELGFFPCVES
jgi:hypothetical protein